MALRNKSLIIFGLMLFVALGASAQRRITPVKPVEPTRTEPTVDESKRKPKSTRPASVVTQVDDTGREFLVDTITGSEYIDSLALAQPKAIGNFYPLFHAVTVGLDLWDPLMRAFGQDYGLAGVWAELSLHNRYNPIVEFGLGNAWSRPEEMNYTYSSPMAPYFKIGCNYNFLYNSNPDYQIYAGVRYGLTRFAFDVTDVSVRNDYWGESSTFSIPRQHSTVGYAEVLAGLKVKLAGRWSLGWCIKYHSILHMSRAPHGKPWYVPGYGTRGSVLGVSLSVMYTLPLNKKSATPWDVLNAPEAPESSSPDNNIPETITPTSEPSDNEEEPKND